jgi:hypothetical protein
MDNDLSDKITALSRRSVDKNRLKPLLLPEWPESKRGTPNTFLRSALFSAITTKNRADLKDVVLASQNNIVIRYTGEQLNQDDLTLWETLVNLSKSKPLETMCEFSCYEILKAMGSADGAAEYQRLDEGIHRLATAHVDINNRMYFGAMILQGSKDGANGRYTLMLNRLLINLYKQNTWIDWDQRLMLKKKPLAQFLHGYYSSHKKPFAVKVETIRGLCGSKTKSKAKFKQNLTAALAELVDIGFLKSYSIDDDLISVERK